MSNLIELTERLAAVAVATGADDLPALAQMHSHLQELERQAEGPEATAFSGDICRIAGDTQRLVERIILHEVTDATKSLQDVGRAVMELQGLVSGVASPASDDIEAEFSGGSPQSAAASDGATASNESNAQPATAASGSPAPASVISADDISLVVEFIGEARGHIESAEAAVLKVEENPNDVETINAIFRAFHTIKGVAGFLNLTQIGSLSHAAENLLDLARKGKLQLVGTAVDLVLESIDLMKALIADLEQAVQQNRPPASHPKLTDLQARLLACAAGETAAATTPAAPSGPATATADAGEKPAASATSGAARAGGETTVKVATDRLDSLINMVGELVIAESMVHQDVAGMTGQNQRLGRNVAHLGKLTRELQELSMSMRMVPIQGVFQKMARLVRDLAKKAGKEVDFITLGGDTELDRNVVEAISDPLVHMVRNSVDHGLETPDDRQKAGKPRNGRVQLSASHQGGSVVIQISDDGRGLNKQRILRKAIENGLVREGQELSEQEIFALIFSAGLSTAEKVTAVSGRGVGMDVVKRNIEALRGRIEIASTEGGGSTFAIKLPLTLAVIDGLVVKVGSERYILPMTSIEQSMQPKPEQLSTVQNSGEICSVRGSLLPLFRLYRLFGVKPLCENPTQGLVVIVQDNQRRCCLLVDELLGQQQVVIKSLGDAIGKIKGVSGSAILGDGCVSLILDVPGLVDLATGN